MDNHQPQQYKQGFTEFYKLKFIVTPDVLIPRPETELLVDEVLKSIKHQSLGVKKKEILVWDVGTGAGNIAVSIAKNCSDVEIIATDVSAPALNIAKKNAKHHGVLKRIKFFQSNLLENLSAPSFQHKLIIIVTNLPYIPSGRIPYLETSVKDYEPYIALDGGKDGFELYRKLLQQLSRFAENISDVEFLLIGEIDYTHGELAVNETYNNFPKAQIEVKKDFAHLQRILVVTV